LRATRDRRAPSRRLATELRPRRVDLHVEVDPQRSDAFRGEVAITLEVQRRVSRIRLHAVDLRVTRPRVEAGARVLRGRVHALPGDEMIEVRLDEMLPRAEVTLRLAFAGRLRKDLCGLYGATADQRRYAFTQLEATDARKFFPCFDEPAMKARFRISVTTASDNETLSNAPIARRERRADGRKTVHFAETPPLSTYLVALAVGRLEASKPTRVGATEIRIWHAPGKRKLTGFGLEAARECLARLERYFGLPYPYAKLDLVAVPDFEFGAMENAGAVFFRETLLLVDPATVTLDEKKRAAEVIAHELAHMWYGDLVTMAWWDDLWLNEAFATWMAFQVVDDWKPEWKLWHDFQHGRAAALELDALRHTHPIYCEVRTPADAAENFDLITYEKGASVVRMLERYLGAAAFRRGVRSYIRRHREGNAVAADLWRALSEASGVAVEPVARAWIERAGFPIVEVRRAHVNGRTELRLRQERFTLRRPRRSHRAPPWPVPWVARIARGRTGRGRLERRLLTRTRERVDLGPAPPRFVYGNADEGGFFRPLHDADEMGSLIGSLASLAAVERMGLVDHQWALVRARRAPIGTILDLAEALADEEDPDVLRTLQRPLGFIAHSLIPNASPACEAPFRDWLVAGFGAAFEDLGWDPAPREAADRRLRRAALLSIVGSVAGYAPVAKAAAARCDRYLVDRGSLDPNLADGVVALAARVGGERRHRRFTSAMARARSPQEQRRFLLALADFREPRLVDQTLAMSLTERVATQDVVSLLARLLVNPAARERSWEFVRKRWPALRRRMPPLLASRLIEATFALLEPSHRNEVARFFRAHPLPSGERALRQTLERFDWYRGFRREAAGELAARLSPVRAGLPPA
jgi:puromycin-sensitive aminopeptidase